MDPFGAGWVGRYVRQFELRELNTILGAIEQSVLTILYEGESGRKERDVQLVGVYAMNGKWYCPAFDYASGEYRLFRADRILSVAESSDQSRRKNHDEFTIHDWFIADKERNEVAEELDLKVRLTRRGVLLCRGDVWLGSGLIVNEDGSGRIERRISQTFLPWAASFFLSCGTDAAVESPQELRQLILGRLQGLYSVYGEEGSEIE